MKQIEVMPACHLSPQVRDLGISDFTFVDNYADLGAAVNALC
jgi:hypothetical protein